MDRVTTTPEGEDVETVPARGDGGVSSETFERDRAPGKSRARATRQATGGTAVLSFSTACCGLGARVTHHRRGPHSVGHRNDYIDESGVFPVDDANNTIHRQRTSSMPFVRCIRPARRCRIAEGAAYAFAPRASPHWRRFCVACATCALANSSRSGESQKWPACDDEAHEGC